MLCEKCEREITSIQKTRGKCSICGKPTYSSQLPKNTVCDTCAWTKDVCSVCTGELV